MGKSGQNVDPIVVETGPGKNVISLRFSGLPNEALWDPSRGPQDLEKLFLPVFGGS